MKLTIDKDTLTKALRIVGRAVHGKHSLPVLDNVLLQASDTLTMAGTDLEFAITCQVNAKIEEAGSITVPARLFGQVVDAMPEGEVTLTLNLKSCMVTVQGTRRKANVKGIEAAEFPPLPTVEGETRLTLDPRAFREAITQTTVAAAKDDTRPALAGILCEFEADKLTMAGADGFRLAVRTLALPAYVPSDTSVIVPAKALGELARLIGDDTKAIELVPGEKHIMCHIARSDSDIPSIDVMSWLINAGFPAYRRLIPTTQATRVETNIGELASAVRLVSVFGKDGCYRTLLEMGADEMLLIVRNNATQEGDSTAEFEATLTGDPLRVVLDARYLSDALGAITTERVVLEATGPDHVVLIKPVGRDDYVYAVMPMTELKR